METTEKAGILGGTFNPVHAGHLILAQTALETLDLTKVVFVPCSRPPHKAPRSMAEAKHRLAMTQKAVECDPRFEVSDVEIARGGVSYSIDTVREFRKRAPGTGLVFIIGTDTLAELHLWKDVYELLKLCELAAFERPGSGPERVSEEDIGLDPPYGRRLLEGVYPGRKIEISSSDIRYRAAEGLSIRYLVPETVEMYIAEHRLYGT
ncbi:MAG: nicotinate-nucleotide adenylyltransferase [Kiritimatiellia bacterium]